MNILFISPHYLWGGASIANITISKMLIQNGHHVIYSDEYFPDDSYEGIPIDHTQFHSERKTQNNNIVNYVKKHEIDVIIWSPIMVVYYYYQLGRLKNLGVKHISIVHSLSLKKNFKTYIIDLICSFALSKLNSVVFVSQFTKKSWSKFLPLKFSKCQKVTIFNPIIEPNISDVHSKTLTGRMRIGFVGRFSEEKQPELFCKLSQLREFDFHAWGDGPLLNDLKSSFKNITFHGLEKDISKIYSNIDILIMTSKFENCPLVLLEAKVRGIPCIAPKVGGIPEIIEEGKDGLLYDTFNESKLLKKIYKIRENYSEYSDNCILFAKKFVFNSIYKEWQNILIS